MNGKLAWKVAGIYATPRDSITHVKLLRRNLFTASRDQESDGKCMCCGTTENQQHLAECVPIRYHFWKPLIRMMKDEGMNVPAGWREETAMLLTYRVSNEEVVTREQADLIQIGFRSTQTPSTPRRHCCEPLPPSPKAPTSVPAALALQWQCAAAPSKIGGLGCV